MKIDMIGRSRAASVTNVVEKEGVCVDTFCNINLYNSQLKFLYSEFKSCFLVVEI